MPNDNGWTEWSKHVLAELKRLNGCVEKIEKVQQDILVEMSALKVKSGVWGLLGGAIPAVIVLIWWIVKNN